MAHPSNKWERRYIGDKKAHKRIQSKKYTRDPKWSPNEVDYGIARSTSKTCACGICVNPRTYGHVTLQEEMAEEAYRLEEVSE